MFEDYFRRLITFVPNFLFQKFSIFWIDFFLKVLYCNVGRYFLGMISTCICLDTVFDKYNIIYFVYFLKFENREKCHLKITSSSTTPFVFWNQLVQGLWSWESSEFRQECVTHIDLPNKRWKNFEKHFLSMNGNFLKVNVGVDSNLVWPFLVLKKQQHWKNVFFKIFSNTYFCLRAALATNTIPIIQESAGGIVRIISDRSCRRGSTS